MDELTERHVKFLEKKAIPVISSIGDDATITFDDCGYYPYEVIEWIENIIKKGEYDSHEKRFLTGVATLYEHIKRP